jgi:DNA-binding MarR family transcriptional regulator
MSTTRAGATEVSDDPMPEHGYAVELERATRGLLALNVVVLEGVEKKIGLAPLRALQSLQRLGPCLVTELGEDLDLAPSSASRLSDRLAEAGFITRSVAPHNRRATLLEMTDAGRAILDDVVTQRIKLLSRVAEQMNQRERDQLLRGAEALTAASNRLAQYNADRDGG